MFLVAPSTRTEIIHNVSCISPGFNSEGGIAVIIKCTWRLGQRQVNPYPIPMNMYASHQDDGYSHRRYVLTRRVKKLRFHCDGWLALPCLIASLAIRGHKRKEKVWSPMSKCKTQVQCPPFGKCQRYKSWNTDSMEVFGRKRVRCTTYWSE